MIFQGKVIGVEKDTLLINRYGRHPEVITFQVDKSWIGIDTSVKNINVFQDAWDCDIRFYKDSIYLVYALVKRHSETPFYWTDNYSRTSLLRIAKPDIDSLGKAKTHKQFKRYLKNKNINQKELYKKYNLLFLLSIVLNVFLLIILIKKKR